MSSKDKMTLEEDLIFLILNKAALLYLIINLIHLHFLIKLGKKVSRQIKEITLLNQESQF